MVITGGAIIAIIIVLFVLFGTKFGKQLRLRASGTAEEAILKDASTPEGAKAYYNAAIAKKDDDYRKAYSIYTQMLGKIESYGDQLRTLQKENAKLNINIDSCIKNGDDEAARTYLRRQSEVSDQMLIIKNALDELEKNSKLQKETVDDIFDQLKDLKSEKDSAVLQLETAQVTQSLQATTSDGEEDKMLEKVRDSVKKKTEQASGSKVAYENSATVQQKRLDKRMKDDEIDKRLEQLKKDKNIAN